MCTPSIARRVCVQCVRLLVFAAAAMTLIAAAPAFTFQPTGGGLGLTPTWTSESNQQNAFFGFSVASAGDVNKDGFDDVIVGAPSYTHGQTREGVAFVWYGGAPGLGANGTPLNTDWLGESNQPAIAADGNVQYGASVASAGDLNGDGYDDVIVGAPRYNTDARDQGAVFVYLGSATGLQNSPAWTAHDTRPYALFGAKVASAGDVNGDGFDDILVGAPGCSQAFDVSLCGAEQLGRVYLWLGSAAGLGPAGTPTNADWIAESDALGTTFGSAVAGAGDVNGDGFDDIVVGSPWHGNGQAAEGIAFLWLGSSTGLGPNGTPSNADWTAEGQLTGAFLGRSVNTAGDVNKDGFADIIIGASGFESSSTQVNEGAAFVWLGSASGMGPAGTPANAAWRAESNQSSAVFGWSVGSAGDVNHDGYADVIVGSYTYHDGQTDEGAAFVWYGGPGGLGLAGTPANADWTAESDQAGAFFGYSASSAGDVNGDGASDVIVGAYGYDAPNSLEGRAFLYPGSRPGVYVSVNGTALQPLGGNALYTHTARVLEDGSAEPGRNDDSTVAHVDLPHGERIEQMRCVVLDNSNGSPGGFVTVRLLRGVLAVGSGTLPPTPTADVIASASTMANGASISFVELNPTVNPLFAIVDNARFAYWLEVTFNNSAFHELRFRGCSIKVVELDP